jgi:hypothetical protein
MRITSCLLVGLFTFVTACTKQNPNLCCVDEADCAAVGLSDVTGCDDGLLCRGNQCIAEVCESSAECDADAPYCQSAPDGRCQPTCTDDSQCPGFGQPASQTFCDAGACVECRADANDCSGTTPVCDTGRCVACTANEQCASGACSEGSCADESMIAYVAPTGSPTAACTMAAPCSTIEAALQLTPAKPIIVIESGTYSQNAALMFENGSRRLIGRGPTRPILQRATTGPIALVQFSGQLSVESLEIRGATGGTTGDTISGHGVVCVSGGAGGGRSVRFVDAVLRQNTANGFLSRNCAVEVIRSQFVDNAFHGAAMIDTTAVIDRSTFSGNERGLQLDFGTFTLTNSFITRNSTRGLELFASVGTRIEFNTIVDNGGQPSDVGFSCNSTGLTCPNNIIARNRVQTLSSGCTFPDSIIIDLDITPLMFVSPDVAPFDYHIQSGSLAIDQAMVSTVTSDFDGDPRPRGGGFDIGADEL